MKWDAIRGLGEIKYLHFILVFPFLPVALKGMNLLPGTEKIIADILYLYFGATMVSIATALYLLFCPKIIKQYASFVEYYNANRNLITTNTKCNMYNMLADHNIKVEGNPVVTPDQDIARAYYEYYRNKAKVIRYLTVVLYMAGFFLGLEPVLRKFVEVLQIAIKLLFS